VLQEHLQFYARLKGVPSQMMNGLVQYIAELTDLDGDPLRKAASSLSGGMKRRLSLGISLIGNPKIWLLDEPSTGLSPETRREIWSIVEKRKRRSRARPGQAHGGAHGKAIVITTHSMDEADTLCTRIGILADGGLQCIGSAAHLKTRFGEGFKFTLHLEHEFEQSAVEEAAGQEGGAAAGASGDSGNGQLSLRVRSLVADARVVAQHVELLRFVQRMAPHAKLTAVQGKQVVFHLHPQDKAPVAASAASSAASASSSSSSSPSSATSRTAEVLGIFNAMEQARAQLLPRFGILEWGLAQSSLEEVFVAICSKFEKDDDVLATESKKTK
jgi:energy-coupling factor transporter ATP-binding protein EcfA2